jgi:hypothetical protein
MPIKQAIRLRRHQTYMYRREIRFKVCPGSRARKKKNRTERIVRKQKGREREVKRAFWVNCRLGRNLVELTCIKSLGQGLYWMDALYDYIRESVGNYVWIDAFPVA